MVSFNIPCPMFYFCLFIYSLYLASRLLSRLLLHIALHLLDILRFLYMFN